MKICCWKQRRKIYTRSFFLNSEPSSDIAKVERVFEEITIVWRNPLYGVRKHDFKLKHSFIFSDSLIPGLRLFYFHIKYRKKLYEKKFINFEFRYLPLCGLIWWIWEWTYSSWCSLWTHTNHKTRYHSAYIVLAYLFCSYNIHKRVENGYCVGERFYMINLKDGSFCVLLVEVCFFLRDFSCIYQSVLIEIDKIWFFTGCVVLLLIKKNTITYPNTVIS